MQALPKAWHKPGIRPLQGAAGQIVLKHGRAGTEAMKRIRDGTQVQRLLVQLAEGALICPARLLQFTSRQLTPYM